jgi:hypothetical protein
MVPMQHTMASLVAILVAMPLASCSMNLNWDSDKPSATAAASDDTTCQSAGYTFGTPEYQQCLQNLVQQRANAERAEIHPYYVPQR